MPFYNGHQYLPKLLSSLPAKSRVHIIDDMSDTPVNPESLVNYPPYVALTRLEKKGYFSGAVNEGINSCNTDVLVLNQDTWFDSHAFMGIIDQYRDRYAMIGERIKGQNAAWPNGYIHGTFAWFRRDALDKIGGLDAERYPLWGSTALWQLQACRAGFNVLPLEEIPGFHHERGPKEHFGTSIKSFLRSKPNEWDTYLRVPPLVSVVIPAYNHGKYLPDAVHSLIGGKTSLGNFPPQTFQSFEIIIVDDASTDDTPAICGSLCNNWHGIRSIRHKVNRGTAAAHNTGIEAALGKYITTMSADDMREPWALEKLVTTLEANSHSLVYDELTWFANGKRMGPWIKNWEEYDLKVLMDHNLVPVGTMFTKQAWKEVGGYPEVLKFGREDWGFALAMGRAGYCGVRIPERGYLYRRHGDNRTERNTSDQWREKFKAQMVGLFPDLYHGRIPEVAKSCCGGGGGSSSRNISSSQTQSLLSVNNFPGAIGMTPIEYTGKNVGSVTWGGPKAVPSKRNYVFGNNERDRIKLVEDQDVAWFLSRRVDGKQIFQRVNQPNTTRQRQSEGPEPIPVKPVNPVEAQNNTLDMTKVQAIQSSKEIDLGEFDVQKVQVVPDESKLTGKEESVVKTSVLPAGFMLEEMTVKDVLEMDFNQEQWQTVYELEKSGRNRKTLIAVLEEKLEAAS